MTPTLNSNERALFAQLADVLIPAGERMPAASQAGVAGEHLDQVLTARPDLATGLKALLELARGQEPERLVRELREGNRELFGILAELVPSAYFLNEEVRKLIGYSGQAPLPIDPHPDYQDDGLLDSVISRGPIYRPSVGQRYSPG
jgi:hypothetical protein